MDKKKARHSSAELLSLAVLVGIVVVLCLCLLPAGSRASSDKEVDNSVSILDRADPMVRKQILTAAMQVFEPSLEMKENVDFLLTPALLVQEAISEDVVITYPSE